MKQTNLRQTPFWKRLFGTTKEKQERTEEQIPSVDKQKLWEKLKEKPEYRKNFFCEQ